MIYISYSTRNVEDKQEISSVYLANESEDGVILTIENNYVPTKLKLPKIVLDNLVLSQFDYPIQVKYSIPRVYKMDSDVENLGKHFYNHIRENMSHPNFHQELIEVLDVFGDPQ